MTRPSRTKHRAGLKRSGLSPDLIKRLMSYLVPQSIEEARRDDARFFVENPSAIHRVRARASGEFPEDHESIEQVCVLRPGAGQPPGSPPVGIVVYETALPGMPPVRVAVRRVVGDWVAAKSCARTQGQAAAGAGGHQRDRTGRDERSE